MSYKLLFGLITLFIVQVAQADDKPYVPTVVVSREEVLKVKDDDIVIGCGDAKHVIIEYSSLSCPHCAQYYKDVFPKLKAEVINKCKAKYVYRDFPTTRSALKGVALARCLTTEENGKVNGEEFFKFIQLLFQSQATWAFSDAYEDNLSKIFSFTGISQEKISRCMADKNLMHDIVAKSFVSMKSLNMSRSPSIFVDGIEIQIPKFDTINDAVK